MQARGAKMVKAKTMVSEEIELGTFWKSRGIESLETDLGEFIVQIDHDHPSHIVKPIIHKNRREIATSSSARSRRLQRRSGDDHPPRAAHLRHKYLEADVGLTGANFVVPRAGGWCSSPTRATRASVSPRRSATSR
jgi:L-lactate dehydrogenase complex protein LldF